MRQTGKERRGRHKERERERERERESVRRFSSGTVVSGNAKAHSQ